MESLFYKLIYEKQLKRGMRILEILFRSTHDVSIKELETELLSSRKTILTTLEYTKTFLPEYFSLSMDENVVILQNDSKETIEKTLIEMAKHTISFQVLEHAFLDMGLNVIQLAEKLFISESALRVRINHMNKALRIFDCSLAPYSLQFVGKEANIRYFAYAYFSEFQELHLSACEEELVYCDKVYSNMVEIYDKQSLYLLDHSYQQIIRFFHVTRSRIVKKNYIKLDGNLIERMLRRQSYRDFKSVYVSELKDHLGIKEIPEDEAVWAYVVSINTVLYTHNTEGRLLYREGIDVKPLEAKISMELREIEEVLNIQKENKQAFIDMLKAYFINLSLLTEISPIFQLGSSEVKQFVMENLGNLYLDWQNFLTKFDGEKLFLVSNKECVAAQLAMISSQFIYKQKIERRKMFFSFEGEPGFIAYLETSSRALLPKDVEAVFIHNKKITTELVGALCPDILVCNYGLQERIDCCEVLRMSYVPKPQEWELLKTLIIDLNEKTK